VTTSQAVLPTLWMNYVLAAFLVGQDLKFYGVVYVCYILQGEALAYPYYSA